MGRMLENTWAWFDRTRWSLIGIVSDPAGDHRRADAGEELAAAYWPAVYGYLRRSGRSRDEASELTQAFFAEVVVGRGLFERADRERGSVRSLLLASLKNFATSEHRREVSRWRRVDDRALEREDDLLDRGTARGLGPEEVFDRRVMLERLRSALGTCREHYERSGKAGHWRLFEESVLNPAASGNARPRMADVAARCGFSSAAAGSAAVQVVCARMVSLLRAECGDGCGGGGGAAGGLDALLGAFGVNGGKRGGMD